MALSKLRVGHLFIIWELKQETPTPLVTSTKNITSTVSAIKYPIIFIFFLLFFHFEKFSDIVLWSSCFFVWCSLSFLDPWSYGTRWTWVWVNSGRWWWTGRPGVLRFMGLPRVGHDWATGLNWTELELQLLSYLERICYFFLEYFCLLKHLEVPWPICLSPAHSALFLYAFLLVFHLWFFF